MSNFLQALFILIIVKLITHIYIPNTTNVCKTFTDYYFPEGNENCYHDPDGLLETPELIKKYAGAVEIHEVTTEDGYILTMFRIPRLNPKGVILLHHSIATYSHVYFFQGNDSLAINLWRNGFDVWLANQRGTSYSDRHENMTKHDYAYWNYSFHEMGIYDVNSELELIREKTNNSKIIYFGHSLGGSIGLVYASLKSSEATKYLKSMVLLGPASTMQSPTFIFGFVGNFVPLLEFLTIFLRIGSPFTGLSFIVAGSRIVLRIFPPIQVIAVLLIWLFCGFTPKETDPTFYSFDAFMYFNNFSWKTLLHYTQLFRSRYFRMYDYGQEKNMELYGNETAPVYPLQNIRVPTLIISSAKDVLVPQKDCEEIFQKLSPQARVYGHWKYSQLNHLDFLNGVHRKQIFTERLIQFMKTVL